MEKVWEINIGKSKRVKVWEKYNHHCAYCGSGIKYKDMQVDHLFPKALEHLYGIGRMKLAKDLRGNNVDCFENLMPSCHRCNNYKGALQLEAFRKQMKDLHKRISKQQKVKVAIDYGIVRIEPFDGVFYFETLMEIKSQEVLPL